MFMKNLSTSYWLKDFSLCVWKTLPLQEITGFHSQCIYRGPYHSLQDNKAENHGSYDGGSISAPQLL